MQHNLKIDVIYYETPSDFEFEFNLGGCCHCRVLNNSTASPKELISCLSKAVNRSRVIIIVGDLNKPNGLYLLISKAIGRQLVDVSAEEYGIISSSDTTIIEGATPLVSTDGLLSGCVIESGPQSLILLPDEKNLRKDVAENLVFQYIAAVSRTPDTDSVITPDSAPEEKVVEQPEEAEDTTPAEIEEIFEENEPEVQEEVAEEIEEFFEQPVEEIMTTEEIADDEPIIEEEEETEEVPEVEEVEVVIDKKDDFFDIFAEEDSNPNDDFVYTEKNTYDEDVEDDYEEPKAAKDNGINILIWVIIGLMFIIIGVLAYMLIYTPFKNGVGITEYIRQIFSL